MVGKAVGELVVGFIVGDSVGNEEVGDIDGNSVGFGVGFKFLGILGVKPFASTGVRKYESEDIFFTETRRDQKTVLSLKLISLGIKFFGFVPEVQVTYDKNKSNIEYYSFDKLQFFVSMIKRNI